MPDKLFKLVCTKTPVVKPATTTPTAATTISKTTRPTTATTKEIEDITRLCECLSVAQLDNYSTWIKIGMILKKLGAPMELWETLSTKSKKFKHGDCSSRWSSFKLFSYTVGSLIALAKEGDVEKLDTIRPTL